MFIIICEGLFWRSQHSITNIGNWIISRVKLEREKKTFIKLFDYSLHWQRNNTTLCQIWIFLSLNCEEWNCEITSDSRFEIQERERERERERKKSKKSSVLVLLIKNFSALVGGKWLFVVSHRKWNEREKWKRPNNTIMSRKKSETKGSNFMIFV
jgi:hypothetical protein